MTNQKSAPTSTECIEQTLATEARVPLSTYRLQMHSEFTFADAQAIVPYLKLLGIGDAYASPIFEARPGSKHGYDVMRHDRLNPELGGDAGFKPFSDALQAAGLGLLLDIVPNHMGVGTDAVWWQDVLENGRASKYSEYFDIDWRPLKPDLRDKLLLPILGNQYGVELEDGNIQVVFEDGQARIHYFDHIMPIAPRTIPLIFPEENDHEYAVPASFRDLLRELAHIPPHTTTEPNLVQQRRAQLEELKPRLHQALSSKELAPVLERAAKAVNGTKGEPGSFDELHALLDVQPYRLAFWRTSSEQINYRRFFDVNDLVGLRMENPEVFAATHCLIRSLLAKGQITGLRIDHCDGMFNPREYLVRLQQLFAAAECDGADAGETATASGIEQNIIDALKNKDWEDAKLPLYCVVEKILEPGEILPRDWPVQGTSGYDFVHFANQIFIQPKNQRRFNEIYTDVLGERSRPAQIIYESKRAMMESSLASETQVLTNLLSQIAGADRRARDFTDTLLLDVIRETIACFPVYRTYIDERGNYSDHDRRTIHQAIVQAKRRNRSLDASAFDFLEAVLLLRGREGREDDVAYNDAQLYFALKFQQLTGPVMAKGVEDTSFYVYTRFISSNEVGSSMEAFGIEPEALHKASAERQKYSPFTMLTTSTHDTKRSEDVRNRLNVLSEMPDQWAARVKQWQSLNADKKTKLGDGQVAPDENEEYLIYQTILGAWPWEQQDAAGRKDFTERIQAYITKALSEAKVNVSWLNPNADYTEAVQNFVANVLTPASREKETAFVTDLLEFLEPISRFGAINSLAQLVLKATSPGVPDFYQGCDMWDLSLVDPDNRRPVDYTLRHKHLSTMLEQASGKGAQTVADDVLATLEDGRAKLWTMHRALATRNELRETFEKGDYAPLSTSEGENIIAYLRGASDRGPAVLVVLPRFTYTLGKRRAYDGLPVGAFWGEGTLSLPAGGNSRWTNAFTGEEITASGDTLQLAEVFKRFPVAMLVKS